MAVQPVLRLHIVAGFGIHKTATWEHRDKQISCRFFTGCRIKHRNGIAGPVHLNGVPRLVLDAHCGLCDPGPLAVFLCKLSAHIGRFFGFIALAAVFLPQKSQRYTVLRQLFVDVRIVRLHIHADIFVLVWKEQPFQIVVGYIVLQRPMYP
jgi:hypothetical protein